MLQLNAESDMVLVMVITLNAQWELKENRRGVSILRRKVRTGTSGGRWMAASTYFDSLGHARGHIDSLPVGHYCGKNERISD